MKKLRRSRRRAAQPLKPLSGPPPEQARPRAKARSSVEDPLLDWTDDEQESDRWLLDRVAGDEQRA